VISTLRRGRVALFIPVLTYRDNTPDAITRAVLTGPAAASSATIAGLRVPGTPCATDDGEDFAM
jgi:hypothetical protein